MKVLIVGDWYSDLHEEELLKSLMRLGHQVSAFKWFEYLQVPTGMRKTLKGLFRRAQNKYLSGPSISKINKNLKLKAVNEKPDLIFVYRGTHIQANTLRAIKNKLPECKLVGYNNDDPFSPRQPKYYWRHFVRSIPVYDLVLAYRQHNLADFKKAGAQQVELLRSWYVPDRNYPVILNGSDKPKYETDVVFAGHYEEDGRFEYLEEVVKQGYKLKIFGPPETWVEPLKRSSILRNLQPIQKVWGEEYNKALCGAKIALCFLSKLNRDTYTRRCFEIPATKTLMLAEHTDDLASLYVDGSEVLLFRDLKDFSNKLIRILCDDEMRDSIRIAGYHKAISAGYDIDSRVGQIFNKMNF
jgi:spore maturation protein CgeB